ncbi:PLP-dependent transferase [Ascoidea rubescens DSM 1968]|uniref:PLP-dependent transferase n=1 Tax=Ascoidea rubescens DSM 1968 TaxID=1344418 RepID=A0A1D2VCU0_9ASCO|nr:PLP-dependent transferase [Ascoidea rubescens DSM 1968]ODV59514.1 PLP-dependent transferase [Ascoidea rubescens DSM 1968]
MPQVVPFGKEFRQKYFTNLDSDVTPVNHGSFGLTPDPVFESYQKNLKRDNRYPDKYILYNFKDCYSESLTELSKVLDSPKENLALVTNATTAVNVVLRSFPFKKGDKILILSTIYGACFNTVKFLENRVGIVPITMILNYPLDDIEIIEMFEKKLQNENIKLSLFDTVSSMPAARLPFKELVDLCKKYNCLSLVDGAHSIGLVKFSLSELKPDFFTSNLHKWFFTPRPAAFLYVDPKHHKKIHTFPVSHSYLDDDEILVEPLEKTRYYDRFVFVGSLNYAAYTSVVSAIRFINECCGGLDNILDYNYNLAAIVGKTIAQRWNTQYLENSKNTLTTAMVNVEVPFYDNAEKGVFIPIVYHNEKIWARFSAQIYTELSDFIYAADCFRESFKKFLESELFQEKFHKI